MCVSLSLPATGRTNTSLRGMDMGLTTATFSTKTQTAISHKNSDIRGDGNGEDVITTELPSGRKATLATKRSTTTIVRPATGTGSGRGSRETTPTRTAGLATAVRAEPLRHTLVRQASPKTKTVGGPGRSKTPSRALSPTADGPKTPRAPTSGEREQLMDFSCPSYVLENIKYTVCNPSLQVY